MANFLLTLKLQETTPPKALIGSHERADLQHSIAFFRTETPQGFACLTITVPVFFGRDFDTPDGSAIRDYIHVVDLAKSHVKAMNFLITKPGKYAYNVGTGNGVSVLDAIKTFEKTNKLIINYSIGPRRSGDIEQIYANSNLIKEELSWQAKESLEEAMKSAWAWEKQKN